MSQLGSEGCEIAELTGFHSLEGWGVWSAHDPAEIVLKEELNGAVKVRFIAYTMNDTRGHKLNITIGDVTRTVTLGPVPARTFELDFRLSKPAKKVVLSGIIPRSPQEVGLGSDTRKVGVGFVRLECGTADSP